MRGLLKHEKIIVGYDLGEDYSQISYCTMNGEVETLSLVAGNVNGVIFRMESAIHTIQESGLSGFLDGIVGGSSAT